MQILADLQKRLDCVFVIDTTGSMDEYIVSVKEAINELVKKIMNETSVESVKFGVVAYRDHPCPKTGKLYDYVVKTMPLSEWDVVESFVANLKADGGDDFPEAALDGLKEAIHSVEWRDVS